MGERKHLRRLGIGAVDEDERRQVVAKREAPELLRVELAAVVGTDDTAHHNQHPERIGLLDESPQRVGPGRDPTAFIEVEAQGVAHPGGDFYNLVCHARGTNKGAPGLTRLPREVAVPLLRLLAEVDGVQQIGTRRLDAPVGHRAQIGNGHGFLGWSGQEEVSDEDVGGLREGFELLECRIVLAPLPGFELGN